MTDWDKRWPEMFENCIELDCPPGWASIVEKTLEEMYKHPQTEVVQIKQKFGGLRLYVCACPAVEKLADRAEAACWFVCEQCGTTKDVTTKGGWRQTLCGECRQNLWRETKPMDGQIKEKFGGLLHSATCPTCKGTGRKAKPMEGTK